MHRSGQNFTLRAKNGRHSKTPSLHLSAQAGEAAGRLTSAARTQWDSLLFMSPAPHPAGTGGDVGPLPLRLAPLKLAPLQLTKEKKNPTDMQTSGRARKKATKGPAPVCASPPTEPTNDPQWPPRARLVRAGPAEQSADRHLLEDVVCRGAPAPRMRTKPSPPSSIAKSPTPAMAVTGQKPPGAAAPQETGRRRLRRARHLEEGRSHDITATGDIKPQEPAAPAAPKDQRAERALREAGRVLEKAAKRDAQQQRHQRPATAGGLEVSGRAIRRTAAAALQDLVLEGPLSCTLRQ
ncbi:unnamed protein product [Lota lota]